MARAPYLALALLVGGLGAFALAGRSELPPIAPPVASSLATEQIRRGAVLAGLGNCAACHTTRDAAPFTGGVGFDTGYGFVYSTNLTPDVESGIGRWSEAAFVRAMREGVARDGTQLLPVFPFTHFALATDADLTALYVFFMSLPPVARAQTPDTLRFPLNFRVLQAGWKLLYLKQGVFRESADKSADWNRGAYLAEGLGHCAACHSPRNRLGAERSDAAYAGSVNEGWQATALNRSNPASLPWTEQDLYDYLRGAASPRHGVAAGSMSGVIHDGLSKLPDADIRALASYFATWLPPSGAAGSDAQTLAAVLARGRKLSGDMQPPGARLYAAACAQCHYNGNASLPPQARPELSLSSTVTAATSANFLQITMRGIGTAEGLPGAYMPGFATALTDADLVLLADYVRLAQSDRPAWTDTDAVIRAIRAAGTERLP